jgi:hypothetical protein
LRDEVVRQIENSQFTEMVDVLDLGDFVAVEVEHVELIQVLQIPDSLNEVFAEHQYAQGWYSMQVCDLFDLGW